MSDPNPCCPTTRRTWLARSVGLLGLTGLVGSATAAGEPALATRWVFAEGSTSPYFETFVTVINPWDSPLPIDVRVQSAKTMHEKFGVVGDDVFSGSANFSESSSTKHSEDRFTIKNQREIAAQFQSEFELLWAKSRTV